MRCGGYQIDNRWTLPLLPMRFDAIDGGWLGIFDYTKEPRPVQYLSYGDRVNNRLVWMVMGAKANGVDDVHLKLNNRRPFQRVHTCIATHSILPMNPDSPTFLAAMLDSAAWHWVEEHGQSFLFKHDMPLNVLSFFFGQGNYLPHSRQHAYPKIFGAPELCSIQYPRAEGNRQRPTHTFRNSSIILLNP